MWCVVLLLHHHHTVDTTVRERAGEQLWISAWVKGGDEKQWWWAAADYKIKLTLSMVTKKRKKVTNQHLEKY